MILRVSELLLEKWFVGGCGTLWENCLVVLCNFSELTLKLISAILQSIHSLVKSLKKILSTVPSSFLKENRVWAIELTLYPFQCAKCMLQNMLEIKFTSSTTKSLSHLPTQYIYASKSALETFTPTKSQQKFERWVQACDIFMHHWVKMMLPCTCSTNGCSHHST